MSGFNSMKYILSIVIFSICMSCKQEVVPTPKPRMYPRVDFPERSYQAHVSEDCPLTFEYPSYAKVTQSEYKYGEEAGNDCWFNIEIPELNAALYCDYTAISAKDKLENLVQNAFKIVSKHNIKANYREESIVTNEHGVKGILFDIKGPVATPYQFYLTDDENHFFRGSLYFNSKVNPDSMQIIHDFVRKDIEHLVSSFQWK